MFDAKAILMCSHDFFVYKKRLGYCPALDADEIRQCPAGLYSLMALRSVPCASSSTISNRP